MKQTLLALIVIAPLSLTLTGCVIAVGGGEDGHSISGDFDDREYENRKKIAGIQLNTTFADVSRVMGVADFNETYFDDGKTVNVVYFRTHRLHKDGLTTKDECTKLVFVNDELTAIE
jgi:predicted small secreted protein